MGDADAANLWNDRIGPGERLVWQGRPRGVIATACPQSGDLLPGLVLVGAGMFWLVLAADPGRVFGGGGPTPTVPGFVRAMGWIPVVLGLNAALVRPLLRALALERTRYALTDSAAYLLTPGPGDGRLRRVAAADLRAPEVTGHPPHSVWFAEETWVEVPGHDPHTGMHGGGLSGMPVTRRRPVGFERVADALHLAGQIDLLRRNGGA